MNKIKAVQERGRVEVKRRGVRSKKQELTQSWFRTNCLSTTVGGRNKLKTIFHRSSKRVRQL